VGGINERRWGAAGLVTLAGVAGQEYPKLAVRVVSGCCLGGSSGFEVFSHEVFCDPPNRVTRSPCPLAIEPVTAGGLCAGLVNLSKIRGCVSYLLSLINLAKHQNERTHPPKNDRFPRKS